MSFPSLHDALPISCASVYDRTALLGAGSFGRQDEPRDDGAAGAERRERASIQLEADAAGIADGDHEWAVGRSEEHTSELQSPCKLVCRLLLDKKKIEKERNIYTSAYIDLTKDFYLKMYIQFLKINFRN